MMARYFTPLCSAAVLLVLLAASSLAIIGVDCSSTDPGQSSDAGIEQELLRFDLRGSEGSHYRADSVGIEDEPLGEGRHAITVRFILTPIEIARDVEGVGSR